MADIQIPQLPTVPSVNGNEQIEAVQEGRSVQITLKQMAQLQYGPPGPPGPPGRDGNPGPTGATGPVVGALEYRGTVPTANDLPATGNTDGDSYVALDTGRLWVYNSANVRPRLGVPTGWSDVAPASIGITGPTGPQGPAGAGITYKGNVATAALLPQTGNQTGDAYVTDDTKHLWVWGQNNQWNDDGPVTYGATGPTGPRGEDSTVPGPIGPTGPVGPAGQTANLVGEFKNRVPAELPSDGLIPKDWDGPGDPPVDVQLVEGDALLYNGTTDAVHTGCIYIYTPGRGLEVTNWINAGRVIGPTGVTGPQGPKGDTITGPTGPQGDAATISVGSVQAGAPGSNPVITNVGTTENAVFDFVIPAGPTGPQGAKGDSITGPTGPQGNSITGPTGPTGPVSKGITYKGQVATFNDLPLTGNVAGDAYTLNDTKHLWIWDGDSWNDDGAVSVGPIGPTGPQSTLPGPPGPQGDEGPTGPTGATGAKGDVGPTGPEGQGVPSGTVMLFVQSTAPTGWTQNKTYNDAALRIVSGTTGGSLNGSLNFTSCFTSRPVQGSVGNGSVSGSCSGTVSGGSVSNLSVSGGGVGSFTITSNETGVHSHGVVDPGHLHMTPHATNPGGAGAYIGAGAAEYTYPTDTRGSQIGIGNGCNGAAHSHSYSPPSVSGGTLSGVTFSNGSISGTASGMSFSGTAINFDVKYVDIIAATKN